jgi:hypothetical protein
MTDKATIKLALEAMKYHTAQTRPIHQTDQAIARCEEALAQPEQVPCGCAECGKKDADGWFLYCVECMGKGEAALPQPTQEPVAVVAVNQSGGIRMEYQNGSAFDISKHVWERFYTTPPQHKPLTDEQLKHATWKSSNLLIDFVAENGIAAAGVNERVLSIGRDVEAAHNIGATK